jgi:putative transposase
VGAHSWHSSGSFTAKTGESTATQCGDNWQSVGQNGGKRGIRGYDSGKKVKGRKRHILVDTFGLIHGLVVHEGNIQDRDGAKLLLWPINTLPCLQRLWADAGYQGANLHDWVKQHLQCELEIVKRSETGFKVLPHRWIVERTFAWLNHSRLLAKEYEKSLESSKTDIYLALTRCMLRRLAPAWTFQIAS